ncbi:phage portal protein [Roseinatronobacter bogoriensis]|uniref:phage portal protein n=1 Tax=Roseinatronobacter bogoriensis TaxID=119542 RepID=UPI001066E8DB|nr:phage portal protein [Rhodobaca bogoriensis]MBB4207274.1 HK97 family phage portal protein [Rhodobaca bogoriensis DSM 18756]TDY65773.1 HK97 family phage portal protein [Rhodobaca bogoriensis DSM 18756]
MIGRVLRGAITGIKSELKPGNSGWEHVSGVESGSRGLSGVGMKSRSGTRVSPETIMQLSSVWACTMRTSQLVSSLPAAMFEKGANDGRREVEDPLNEILTQRPNRDQTAQEFWEGVVAQMLIRGNGPSEVSRINDRVVSLRPLMNATPEIREGRLNRWAFMDRGQMEYLPPEKVFNIPGFSVGGGLGLSVVRHGVHSFGAALAADETSSTFFANAMQPGGVIEYEGSGAQAPNPEQLSGIKALIEKFTGSRKAGKVLMLPPNTKYRSVTMSPEDAQLLETRKFSTEDICRWFGVPPIIIGHASQGQTMWGSGVEAIMLSWLTLGINPLLKRIEARVLKDLVPPARRRNWYYEFNREAMLQMDSGRKGDFMVKMGASGTMTANERRARLNLPRHEDPNADALLAQVALAPLKDLGGHDE